MIQEERYLGLQLKCPTGPNSLLALNTRVFWLDDFYYQTASFTNKDTADYTAFHGESARLSFTRNTLNRKQFASSGSLIEVKMSFVRGNETTLPGSTSISKDSVRNKHQWLSIQLEFLSFPFQKKQLVKWGIHFKSVLNSQSLFANYTASMLALPGLNVMPDLNTYFIAAYRSTQYVCLGSQLIFNPIKNIDFRFPIMNKEVLDDLTFQPYYNVFWNEYSLSDIQDTDGYGFLRSSYFEESEENTVYVIQEVAGTQSGAPKINIMGAAKYGKFEFLLPEFSQIIFSPGPLIFKLRKGLKDFTTEDYLLLTGDPAIIGVACSIVSDITNGKYNLLKWDKQERKYYSIEIDLYERGKIDE